jgi:ankyrin repeat protein
MDPIFVNAIEGDYEHFLTIFNNYSESEQANLINKDFDGATIFLAACNGGSLAIVNFLFKNFVININKQYNIYIDAELVNNATALWCAVYYGHLEIVKFLVENGSNLEVSDKDKNPIHLCCVNGDLEILKFLIENGCLIDSENSIGETPLIVACKRNNNDIVEFLIHKGANLNKRDSQKGFTALHVSVIMDNINLVKLLVENGCDLNITNDENMTALKYLENFMIIFVIFFTFQEFY